MKLSEAISMAFNTLRRNGPSGLYGLILAYINVYREPLRMPNLPAMIQVEPTIHCNLQCRMCVNPISGRKKKHMSLEEFKRIVGGLPDLKKLSLVGAGEPLMNPQLFEMIAYAKSKGISIGFATNGMLLSEKTCEKIINSGAGWVNISVDSADKAKYEAIRGGANFDTLVANIKTLVKYSSGRKSPEISVWFVIMKENMGELADVMKLSKSLGVGKVCVQMEHSWSNDKIKNDLKEARAADFHERIKRFLADAKKTAKKENITFDYVNVPDPHSARACKWPWKSAYITVEGFVTPCCLQGSDPGIVNFGNIFTGNFDLIWNSAPYRDFRAELKSKKVPKICAGCTAYFENTKI